MKVLRETIQKEQITDKNDFLESIYQKIRNHIEKDEFNLLQFRSKSKLDRMIKNCDQKIEKLMQKNTEAKQHISDLKDKIEKLDEENQRKHENLKQSLL